MTETQNANSDQPPGQLPDQPIVAVVHGQPLRELPRNLYIPPEALEVFLDAFEGPLDLLLYLIKKQNLDILDIPVNTVTAQYMQYIDMMEELKLELAAEYLLMAAMLAEIKSRMLLPRPKLEEDEEDPRAELVRRLQEYEQYKKAAEALDRLPRLDRDVFDVVVEFPHRRLAKVQPEVPFEALIKAYKDVLVRAQMNRHHHVQRESLSVRERMTLVLDQVNNERFTAFSQLFQAEEGRAGVVVSLLAILELLKESLVEVVQNDLYGPIYIKASA